MLLVGTGPHARVTALLNNSHAGGTAGDVSGAAYDGKLASANTTTTAPFTLAGRVLHFGRYGYGEELATNQSIQPLFLGYETLIRGYSWESLENSECGTGTGDSSCPVFDRLFGHRIAVANMEVRIPFLGTEQFGLINLPYVPMELIAFTDVGLAWDDENPVDSFDFVRSSSQRVPLWSSGVAARFNVLGFMIFEAYYAYPWQRPEKGAHWGFSLAPGW